MSPLRDLCVVVPVENKNTSFCSRRETTVSNYEQKGWYLFVAVPVRSAAAALELTVRLMGGIRPALLAVFRCTLQQCTAFVHSGTDSLFTLQGEPAFLTCFQDQCTEKPLPRSFSLYAVGAYIYPPDAFAANRPRTAFYVTTRQGKGPKTGNSRTRRQPESIAWRFCRKCVRQGGDRLG